MFTSLHASISLGKIITAKQNIEKNENYSKAGYTHERRAAQQKSQSELN